MPVIGEPDLVAEVRVLKELLREALPHLASVGDSCLRHPDVDKLEDRILKVLR